MLHNLIKWWTIWGPSKCPPHRATHSGRRDTLRAFKRRLRLEPLENRSLLATIMVTTEMDVVSPNDGLTSLREAIIQANDQTTNPGADTINFNIPGSGQHTISPLSSLPEPAHSAAARRDRTR